MTLTAGARIGGFQIISSLGTGGMGEVYRARDTRLGRDVAIKVLPSAVANDVDRLARFDREARTLALLNHPNIAQIYGIEEGPGEAAGGNGPLRALVMELVEGPTLADRIQESAVPLDEVLSIAKQIADALEAAHEHGIVHRDLKPANIKLRDDGTVKVLDFGLAKALGPAESEIDRSARLQVAVSQAPTITSPAMTQMGMILGTAAYMAPEQASGKPVDKRADIWAFGVVLWEMLAGRRMFEGETISHVLAQVLTKEPDLRAVPAPLQFLLARCLEKDPRKRLRDIGDAMSLVRATDVSASVGKTPANWLRVGGWALAGVLAAVLVVSAWFRPAAVAGADPPMVQFQIERSSDIYGATTVAFAVSPDGLRLAHYGPASGGQQSLYIRTLATGEVREIAGSTAAILRVPSLFWSADSQQLVYGTATTTAVVDVTTGTTRPLCDCRFAGGSWNRDGTILLGSFQGAPGGIRRVTANNATPTVVTDAAAAEREADQWPVFLPDGRFLFTRTVAGGVPETYVASFDNHAPVKVTDGSRRIFVPAAGGRSAYLLGIDAAGLVAQPFDVNTASVTGMPVTLVAGAVAAASASDNGVLAVSRPGQRPQTVPTWFDRKGIVLGKVGAAGLIQSVALTADGRKLAVDEFDGSGGGRFSDVWLRDQQSGANTRLTFNPDNDSTPVWSPDGSRIAFSSLRDGRQRLYQRMADGTGNETPLFEFDRNAWVNDWSSDGRWVVYSALSPAGANNDLWAVPFENGVAGTPVPYVESPAREQQAQFSPDGRFVAYGSDQSGTFEIYVQPFPNALGGKWMISNGGGTEPRWSRDGRELFYFSGQTLMLVPVRLQPTFSSGAALALFDAPVLANYANDGHRWQLGPDARRFLILTDVGQNQAPPLDVIVNWPAMLTGAAVRRSDLSR